MISVVVPGPVLIYGDSTLTAELNTEPHSLMSSKYMMKRYSTFLELMSIYWRWCRANYSSSCPHTGVR